MGSRRSLLPRVSYTVYLFKNPKPLTPKPWGRSWQPKPPNTQACTVGNPTGLGGFSDLCDGVEEGGGGGVLGVWDFLNSPVVLGSSINQPQKGCPYYHMVSGLPGFCRPCRTRGPQVLACLPKMPRLGGFPHSIECWFSEAAINPKP